MQHVDPFVLALVTLTPGARCTKMHVFRCRNLRTHKMGNAQKQLTKKRNCELQVRVEQIDTRKTSIFGSLGSHFSKEVKRRCAFLYIWKPA